MTVEEQRQIAALLTTYGWKCEEPADQAGAKEFIETLLVAAKKKVKKPSNSEYTRMGKRLKELGYSKKDAELLGKWIYTQHWLQNGVHVGVVVSKLEDWVEQARKLEGKQTEFKFVEVLE